MKPNEKPVASVAKMIRADHTHIIAVFHRYEEHASPRAKQALVNTVCLALELHAQLEEDILYPAVRSVDNALADKSLPEHDRMRGLMAALRAAEPADPAFDETFLELMRVVLHHVADEETIVLREVERRLPAEALNDLAGRMARRRRQLTLSHAAELTRNAVRAMPASTMLVGAGALIAGGYVIRHALKR